MKTTNTRREFLADVGRGMLVASVGYGMATELGLAPAFAADASDALDFGPLESLVRLMQETPANKLLPALADKLKSGTELSRLVAAGALANARFGGEDYVGFHTMMALASALHMARELPDALAAAVFKVLCRILIAFRKEKAQGRSVARSNPRSFPITPLRRLLPMLSTVKMSTTPSKLSPPSRSFPG
jgi:hypothetical protein